MRVSVPARTAAETVAFDKLGESGKAIFTHPLHEPNRKLTLP